MAPLKAENLLELPNEILTKIARHTYDGGKTGKYEAAIEWCKGVGGIESTLSQGTNGYLLVHEDPTENFVRVQPLAKVCTRLRDISLSLGRRDPTFTKIFAPLVSAVDHPWPRQIINAIDEIILSPFTDLELKKSCPVDHLGERRRMQARMKAFDAWKKTCDFIRQLPSHIHVSIIIHSMWIDYKDLADVVVNGQNDLNPTAVEIGCSYDYHPEVHEFTPTSPETERALGKNSARGFTHQRATTRALHFARLTLEERRFARSLPAQAARRRAAALQRQFDARPRHERRWAAFVAKNPGARASIPY